jgi:hypothetical protein
MGDIEVTSSEELQRCARRVTRRKSYTADAASWGAYNSVYIKCPRKVIGIRRSTSIAEFPGAKRLARRTISLRREVARRRRKRKHEVKSRGIKGVLRRNNTDSGCFHNQKPLQKHSCSNRLHNIHIKNSEK